MSRASQERGRKLVELPARYELTSEQEAQIEEWLRLGKVRTYHEAIFQVLKEAEGKQNLGRWLQK